MAEIPSLLQFPRDLTIDVGKVDVAGIKALTAFISIGDDISPVIDTGARYANTALGITTSILAQIQSVQVPVSTDMETFHGFVVFEGDLVEVKIDFRPFDLDNDGIVEACTGCTCPANCDLPSCPSTVLVSQLQPICYRVWARVRAPEERRGPFQRSLAGVMNRFPIRDNSGTPENEENPGNGAFRFEFALGFPLFDPDPGTFQVSSFAVDYAHLDTSDPLKKLTEHSQQTEVRRFGVPDVSSRSNEHTLVEQEGLEGATSEEQVLKTIRASEQRKDDTSVRYISRYREDDVFWSGTIESTFPDLNFNFESACANLDSRQVVETDHCISSEIDVGLAGLEFLNFVDLNGVVFPNETQFPKTPPF